MNKIKIKSFKVSGDIFDKLLTSGVNIKYKSTNELDTIYCYGYKEKDIIYTNNTKQLICKAMLLAYFLDDEFTYKYATRPYIQYRVNRDDSLPVCTYQEDINGSYATRKVNELLETHYEQDEIEDILNSHQEPYNVNNCELHKTIRNMYLDKNVIYKFSNCYYYDINSAYASALIEMFPRASQELMNLYEHRHDNNNRFKNVLNYYVGCLQHSHTNTRNYIVHRTRKMLVDKINSMCGENSVIIYANTDGFIIQNPINITSSSIDIGEFKIEYQGDVYAYLDTQLTYELGNEHKGDSRVETRTLMRLKDGIAVDYDLKTIEVGGDDNEKPIKVRQPVNVKIVNRRIVEL